MDKDRIKGAGNQVKGQMKETTGRILGDKKLQSEGEAEKLKGKIQSTVGEAKDKVRDTIRDIQREH